MSNSFAPAPSLTATRLACVRNYIKTAVPVKRPIGAHTCYGKSKLGFNCTSHMLRTVDVMFVKVAVFIAWPHRCAYGKDFKVLRVPCWTTEYASTKKY